MNRRSVYTSIAILLMVLIALFACSKGKEELAYFRAMEEYAYGFPLVMMDVTREVTTATSKSGEYSAPMNQFGRMRTLVDPDFKNVVRISRNSLWTCGFVDLNKEPFVYTQPDTNGRYIVMHSDTKIDRPRLNADKTKTSD